MLDGDANGIIHARFTNRPVIAMSAPRHRTKAMLKLEEALRPCVYILSGEDDSGDLRVYIGESSSGKSRLTNHLYTKDFWTQCLIFTSRIEEPLNKGKVKSLEAMMHNLASEVDRCVLDNNQVPKPSPLPQDEEVECADFFDHVLMVCPLLNLRIFEKAHTSHEAARSGITGSAHLFRSSGKKHVGKMLVLGREFIVQPDSVLSPVVPSLQLQGVMQKRQEVKDAGLSQEQGGEEVLLKPVSFTSPSSAGAFVCGLNTNGRKFWLLEGSNKTLGEWQDGGAE